MRKRFIFLCILGVLLTVGVGCSKVSKKDIKDSTSTTTEKTIKKDTKKSSSSKASSEEESEIINSSSEIPNEESKPNKNEEKNIEKSSLSKYTSEQIEYARVWLTAMNDILSNPDYAGLEELNVVKIPAGTPVNPSYEESAKYPVDVVQLRGGRLIDGSVTYKSNGDGTITIYNTPMRWETNVNTKEYTQSIVDNPSIMNVDIGDDDKIESIIKITNVKN